MFLPSKQRAVMQTITVKNVGLSTRPFHPRIRYAWSNGEEDYTVVREQSRRSRQQDYV